jgi:RNA polymerase sigma-70 factor (ECF subfamily)
MEADMAIVSGSFILSLLAIAIPFVGMATAESTGDDDSTLIQAVLDGDPSAYRGIVERYQGRIYSVVYGMLRNPEDAKEVSQEAFVKAYQKLSTFRLESKFYTWICRISINLSIDLLRKRKRRDHSEFDEGIGAKDSSGQILDMYNNDRPDKAVERSEIHRRIIEEVEKLPPEQKQAIVLREIDGLSYREISEIMNIPEGTVMSRLFYARKKLQEALAEFKD